MSYVYVYAYVVYVVVYLLCMMLTKLYLYRALILNICIRLSVMCICIVYTPLSPYSHYILSYTPLYYTPLYSIQADSSVSSPSGSRLSAADIDTRLAALTAALETFKRQKSSGTSGNSGGGWQWPFFFLTLLVLGAVGGMYMFYLHLVKKWKLP